MCPQSCCLLRPDPGNSSRPVTAAPNGPGRAYPVPARLVISPFLQLQGWSRGFYENGWPALAAPWSEREAGKRGLTEIQSQPVSPGPCACRAFRIHACVASASTGGWARGPLYSATACPLPRVGRHSTTTRRAQAEAVGIFVGAGAGLCTWIQDCIRWGARRLAGERPTVGL